jgi:hypothetical protein
MTDNIPARQDPPEHSKIHVERTPQRLRIILPKNRVLTVIDERLTAECTEWFGRVDEQQWTRRQLFTIRRVRKLPNDHTKNCVVLIDPYPGEGKRYRIECASEAEADWLAALLRQELRLPDAEASDPLPFLERSEQPSGSKMIYEPLSGGFRITVPKMGFGHPNIHFHMAGVVLFLALTAFFGWFLYLHWLVNQWDFGASIVGLAVVITGLAFIGAAVALVGRAQRHALVTVLDDTLSIQQTNLYRTKRQEWARSSIADVLLGYTHGAIQYTGTRPILHDHMNPFWELQIHLDDGTIVHLFDGYDDAELQWMATVLRRALRIPEAVRAPA